MIIGKYIRQLLNDSKQVVFPGFGNLEVKEVKGTVSQTGAKINPPGLTVKFDSGFSKDDGLLAATMVYGEGMKQEDADQRVLPPVEPYLHGVAEWEPPRTQIAWREEVDLITGERLERERLPHGLYLVGRENAIARAFLTSRQFLAIR